MTEIVFLCVLYFLNGLMYRSKITGCISTSVHSRNVDHWIS